MGERHHLLVHSLDSHNGWGWAKVKPGDKQIHLGLPHGCRALTTQAIFQGFDQVINKELDQRGAAGTGTAVHMGCWYRSGGFTRYAISKRLASFFLFKALLCNWLFLGAWIIFIFLLLFICILSSFDKPVSTAFVTRKKLIDKNKRESHIQLTGI